MPSDYGISWIDPKLMRTSHALATENGVWLIDPVEDAEALERVAALGAPAGVLELLDRHNRDCVAIASRLGVPYLRFPDDAPGSPFEVVRLVRRPGWKESALWWPERRVLVVAEALGTTEHFTLGSGPVGVHPLLRLTPPWALREYVPDHLLVGHGNGVHGSHTAAAVEHALETARAGAPKAMVRLGALLVSQATRRATRSRAR